MTNAFAAFVARALLGVVLVLVACAPSRGADQAGDPGPGAPPAPRVAKNLTIAIVREPTGLHEDLAPGLTTSGNRQVHLVAHNYLVVRDDRGTRLPQLAEELISLEKGTWRVHPDGTMETVWKIRSNVKWQDGAPFTTDDLVFAFNVYKDPEVPNKAGVVLRAMASAQAPDPLTFVVRWSATFAEADRALGLIPLPRHLFEEPYRTERANLVNSPLLGPEFVGLGPYRLTRWEPGEKMEFARFDEYFLGRPPLDTVVLRFIGDPNTMVASILGGAVDVLLPTGIDLEVAADLRRRWEGTGNQVTVSPNGALQYLLIQHRPEYAHPRNGFTVRLVRQAFYHGTDRQAVADVASAGLAPISDGWIPPTHELYPRVRGSIPQYPFDLSLAQQQLAQAGWTRASQSDLVHQPSGERFEVEVRSPPGLGSERMLATIADSWKALGAQVEINVVPAARASDAEYRVTLPGASITGNIFDQFFTGALDSRQAASPANRWTGMNRAGYANPSLDALYEKLAVTISPPERLAIHQAMLAEAMGDVAFIPLLWQQAPVLALKGVHGIRGMMDNTSTWNMFEWTKN